jgi:O-antigen ligase
MARPITESRPLIADLKISRGSVGSRAELVADIIGLALLCAAAVWAFASAAAARSDPLATLILLVMVAAGTIAGRLAPSVAPVVLLGVAAVLLISDPLSFVSRDATSFGFSYENAKGAFFAQVAAAGIIVAGSTTSSRIRTAALTGAVVFAVTPFFFGSLAAGVLGSVLVGVSLATMGVTRKAARLLAMALAGALLVSIAGTIVLGTTYGNDDDTQVVGRAVNSTLSERRRLLWADALDDMHEDPVFGVGPGRFEQTSELALLEEDVRWVPSLFLEQGAEAGLPGLVLVVLIFAWAFGRMVIGGRPGWLVVTGAAAILAIGVHASMDFILHYPLIPLAAGAIFGSTTSAAWKRNR